MSVAAKPVRLDFADYVLYTETHPDGEFELLDGLIFKFAPEGDAHLATRSGIHMLLTQSLDLARYTPWTEASFPAPGYAEGPRPDNLVARGPWIAHGIFADRPTAEDIALVIEVSSSSRPKDRKKAKLYARLGIPEYWLVDLIGGVVVVHDGPVVDDELHSYRYVRECNRGDSIASTAVDGLTVATNMLLQRAK